MWRNAGEAVAKTLCLLFNGFTGGISAPERFSEPWLAVVLKDEKEADKTGDIVQGAALVRPLLLKATGTKELVVIVARATKPVIESVGPMPHREALPATGI